MVAYALIEGPDYVRQVHSEFIAAGADVVTTDSYAIVPFHVGEERFRTQGRELAALAGKLARAAADAADRPVHVAGSIPPVFGSYRPELFDAELAPSILKTLIDGLSPYVDIWLAETQSSMAEILAIRAALGDDTRPLWISFTLNDDDDLTEEVVAGHAEPTYAPAKPSRRLCRRLVNSTPLPCSSIAVRPRSWKPPSRAAVVLDPNLPIGVYANAFVPETKKLAANTGLCDIRDDLTPDTYLTFAQRWVDAGATIIGGCCGIGTSHIAELAATFKPANVPA